MGPGDEGFPDQARQLTGRGGRIFRPHPPRNGQPPDSAEFRGLWRLTGWVDRRGRPHYKPPARFGPTGPASTPR